MGPRVLISGTWYKSPHPYREGRQSQPYLPCATVFAASRSGAKSRAASRARSSTSNRAFRQGLNDTGFIEGQNVLIEYRSAEGYPSRLAPLASELVTRQVSVIFCDNIAALAAKAATKSIPIVFAGGGDAVQEGLVVSLNRPGGRRRSRRCAWPSVKAAK